MSLAARLNKRVTLQTLQDAQDAAGQPIATPVDIATVWAEVRDVSGRLFIGADQKERSTTTEILIRARADLPSDLHVSYKGVPYRVEAILGQDNRTLRLTCIKVDA